MVRVNVPAHMPAPKRKYESNAVSDNSTGGDIYLLHSVTSRYKLASDLSERSSVSRHQIEDLKDDT
mgnify:CR=1 FL=1